MQPGGHIEKFENPIDCAIREVKEETGIDIGFLKNKIISLKEGDKFLPIPDFFQEQSIPEYGKESSHFHLDTSYVVEIKEQTLSHSSMEVNDMGWFTKVEALKLPIHENTKIILQKLLD